MEWNTGGGLDDRTFEDYDPAVEWSHAADADTATISLPGFRKEELRTDVYSDGSLRARGERPVAAGGSHWIRFRKYLKLPDDCDIDGAIRSKFANETLTVTFPKKSRRASPPDGSAPPDPSRARWEADDEEGAAAAGEKPSGRWPSPSRRLLATVGAAFFVGITAYVVWGNLRSGCAAGAGAGAGGGHGHGELAGTGTGAGSYTKET